MYPIDTKQQECRDKFTRARCVVIGKDYRYVFMYFFLTDDNAKDLNKYLAQLKGDDMVQLVGAPRVILMGLNYAHCALVDGIKE